MPKSIFNATLLGFIFALCAITLFGVADIQCSNSTKGPNWNAEKQECEP